MYFIKIRIVFLYNTNPDKNNDCIYIKFQRVYYKYVYISKYSLIFFQ